MSFGGALFALTAVQAVTSIAQGYAQKAENNYNATLLEGKVNLLEEKRQIENAGYVRAGSEAISKSMANTAKNGLLPGGSVLAVMVETQKNIAIDQAISNFNYEQEKNYTKAQASAQRRAGSAAVSAGYTNAFTSLLQGASTYAMYKTPKKSTTFDYSTKQPVEAFGGGVKVYRKPIFR